jgi:hypothetical protein
MLNLYFLFLGLFQWSIPISHWCKSGTPLATKSQSKLIIIADLKKKTDLILFFFISHTFTHVGTPSAQEIASCKSMLSAYGGIPTSKIQGFRAPFLNYTKDTLNIINQQSFLYDSSSSAATDDVYWPYTLDNGMANDCWTGICAAGEVKLPGLWEIPMYSVMDNASVPQLMDVYLSGSPSDVTTCKL